MTTTRLTRSNSELSLYSAAETEDIDLEPNFFSTIKEIHMYLSKVIKDGGLPKSSATLLRRIKHKLPELQAEFTKIAHDGAYFSGKADEASKRADEYKYLFNKFTSRLPTKECTTQAIEETMDKHLSHIHNIQQEMDTLRGNIKKITVEAQKSTCTKQETAPTSTHSENSTANAQPSTTTTDSDDTILKHRRTIIMKNRTSPYKTGRDIRTHLCSLNIACPATKIENIHTKRTHLEIICKTGEHKDTIIRELQSHQELNRQYNFTTKSIPKQKMVLLGVPDNYKNEDITKEITQKFCIHQDDIIHLKTYKINDTGCSNRVILIPISIARDIINTGGLRVGFKKCKLSPYTQITRCRNCQSLQHNERTCPNSTKCERCGGPHQLPACKATDPTCTNCHHSNQTRSTKYLTNHEASDRNCYTYRNAYSQEREKLNNIFYTSVNDNENAPPPLDMNNYPPPPIHNQDHHLQPPGPEARPHTGDSPHNYWFPRPPYWYPNYYY